MVARARGVQNKWRSWTYGSNSLVQYWMWTFRRKRVSDYEWSRPISNKQREPHSKVLSKRPWGCCARNECRVFMIAIRKGGSNPQACLKCRDFMYCPAAIEKTLWSTIYVEQVRASPLLFLLVTETSSIGLGVNSASQIKVSCLFHSKLHTAEWQDNAFVRLLSGSWVLSSRLKPAGQQWKWWRGTSWWVGR